MKEGKKGYTKVKKDGMTEGEKEYTEVKEKLTSEYQ